jgi:hypothetical protein
MASALVNGVSVNRIARHPKLSCSEGNIARTFPNHFPNFEALHFFSHLASASRAGDDIKLMMP